jgi:transcriptional regulator with XRE-family HTH domain
MKETTDVLLHTTIGEVIRQYRERANLTLSQLGNLTGVHKGVISKIENGETKRPELKTIKAISTVLDIPYVKILEHYMDVEQRTEVLREILLESIKLSSMSLISKAASKFLQSPYEESHTALERLYLLTETVSNMAVRLLLYDLVIQYARQRGMQRYLAKGLLQKYLIERSDLKRLEESFRVGEEIIHYVDFLSQAERITLYFRMALHAHNIKRYQMCIDLCEAGLLLETADTELKARAYLAMINSLSRLGHYDAIEKHLEVLETFDYDFVAESTKITRAVTKTRRKEFDVAIPMLRNYLEELHLDNKIHAVNELLDIYLQRGDVDAIADIIKQESDYLPLIPQTPYKLLSVGRYYRQKGTYQTRIGLLDDGMNSYMMSLQTFGSVSAFDEIAMCMNEILGCFTFLSKSIDLEYVVKLKNVYNRIAGKNKQ